MHPPLFFTEILEVLLIATAVAILFERLKLPAILGFLLTGVIIGAHGFKVLTNYEHIRSLSELGVVLLMLTIGLEFSFDRLQGMKGIAMIGGTLQIVASLFVALLFVWWKGWTFYEGFFLGSVIALSSTAIVLKYLIDRGELDTPHGRVAIAILIFQDLAVVPLMIFLTVFGGKADTVLAPLGIAFLKTVGLLSGAYLFARYLLPKLLERVMVIRNREIFFLFSIEVCLGMAWVSGVLGLSVAIGALLAGFMFANTEFSHQLMGDIIPFRYFFVSIFFVSIGLLFDVHFFFEHTLLVLSVVGLVLFVNFVIMTLIVLAFGYPPRVAVVTGIILSQIGEFSFLLIQTGYGSGHISGDLYQLLLSAAFLTLLITPFLFSMIPAVLKISSRYLWFGLPHRKWVRSSNAGFTLQRHVILCGFGPTGRDLAQAFQEEKIPFVIIEMNPVRVIEARKNHKKIIYGDAANQEVMKRAGILKAKAVVVSFPDILGIKQIISVVQDLNPEVFLAVRTRYELHMPQLYELGADLVVMEEWEAGHELNRVLLEKLDVPLERIKNHLDRIRSRKEVAVEESIFRRAGRNDTTSKGKI